MQRKNIYYIISAILVICILISVIQNDIVGTYRSISSISFDLSGDEFRSMKFAGKLEEVYCLADEYSMDRYELLAIVMIMSKYDLDHIRLETISRMDVVRLRNQLVKVRRDEYIELVDAYKSVLIDIAYFPIACSTEDTKWVSYVNSWGVERTYGGIRTHEGTDVIALENIKGIYPIISITGGVVTNKGWLEKGGYRLGITAPNGAYFYYAHLASYADNVEVGSTIIAGQFLGFMGNTGYSQVEGTTDKFDVHLHMGMYLYTNGEEISVNPYWILRFTENKVLYYSY